MVLLTTLSLADQQVPPQLLEVCLEARKLASLSLEQLLRLPPLSPEDCLDQLLQLQVLSLGVCLAQVQLQLNLKPETYLDQLPLYRNLRILEDCLGLYQRQGRGFLGAALPLNQPYPAVDCLVRLLYLNRNRILDCSLGLANQHKIRIRVQEGFSEVPPPDRKLRPAASLGS